MGYKSRYSQICEENKNERIYNESSKIDDIKYKKILDIDNNVLVDAFILELFFRNDAFKLIYDDCYSSILSIKDCPTLFIYQSEHYQELIRKHKQEFSTFGYNIHNVLVSISLTIAREHDINYDSFPKKGYSKSNPLIKNYILDDEYYDNDEYYNISNFLDKYTEDCSIYKYNFNYPQHNMFKQKSINANINLYADNKEQLKELDRLTKFINQIKKNKVITNNNKVIGDIEKFVNKQKQIGILIHLYYYDCSKEGMLPKYIYKYTKDYPFPDNMKEVKTKFKSIKDNRVIDNYKINIKKLIMKTDLYKS